MACDANKQSLLSIIMPTYNRASYIGETIESIRAQTHSNWELLIIDDGSTDETSDIVAGIQDKRIQFIPAGRIGNHGRIKNMGLEKVTGDLIAFSDSDDLWAPDKLRKQVEALARNVDAGFCLTGGFNFRDSGQPISHFYSELHGERVGDLFLPLFRSEIAAFAQALVFRRQCLELSGRFNEGEAFTDAEFIVRLASRFIGIVLYEPLLMRRLHADNWSGSNWERGHEMGLSIIRSYRDQKLLPLSTAREALFQSHINFGEKYLLQKKRLPALGQFLNAWANKPFSAVPMRKIVKGIVR